MEEFAHAGERVGLRHQAMAVHRLVAESGDEHGLVEHRAADGGLEGRLMNERAEIILIRELERRVVLVEPAHSKFQRAPGVETGRPRIARRISLRLDGRRMEGGPLGLEEGEVAHAWFNDCSASRRTASISLKDKGSLMNIGRMDS